MNRKSVVGGFVMAIFMFSAPAFAQQSLLKKVLPTPPAVSPIPKPRPAAKSAAPIKSPAPKPRPGNAPLTSPRPEPRPTGFPATISGKTATIELHVVGPATYAGMDKAGMTAAELVLRANPTINYVEITVYGRAASGDVLTTRGGWTRQLMKTTNMETLVKNTPPFLPGDGGLKGGSPKKSKLLRADL